MCWCSLAEAPPGGLRALVRPRDVALALIVGLLVTLIVVWRDADRSDATYVIGAAPRNPLGDVEISGVPRRSFALPRLSPGGRGRVLLQIATYFEPPTATLRLQVLDANGRVLSRCTIPPASYRDNGLIPCDVPDVSRARRVVVSHAGRARLGVYAHSGVAGYLAYTSGGDLFSRVRSVLDRVGISLPAHVGAAVLIGGLWLSTAASALAVLLAIGLARSGPDALLEHGEPLGESIALLAEPRDDEREVQHDGEEEAEGDDEQRVGRGDDAEHVGDAGEQGGPGREDEHGQTRSRARALSSAPAIAGAARARARTAGAPWRRSPRRG